MTGKPAETLIEKVSTLTEEDEFAGVYGYNDTFFHAGFLDNRYFVFTSGCRGYERLFMLDTDTKQLARVRTTSEKGMTDLMRKFDSTLIVQLQEDNVPARICALTFGKLAEAKTVEEAASGF